MALQYDIRFSLEETAAQVDLLEEYIGVGETPLAEDETVEQLQNAMQHRVAYRASELMTGMRMHQERQHYLDTYSVYRRLLGAVALDGACRAYEETGCIDTTKKTVREYLKSSKLQMVALDYKKRLEKSPMERVKQRVAQSDKARFVVPRFLAAVAAGSGFGATTLLLESSETPSFSSIEIAPTVRGALGAIAILAVVGAKPAIRGASKQVGSLLGAQVNMQMLTYVLDKFDENDTEKTASDLESLIGGYAVRDLESQLEKTGSALMDYDMKDESDIAPLVAHALDVTEAAMHKHYGVDPEREWPEEWYLRLPSKLLRIDLAN